MNLHGFVASQISAVNPFTPALLRLSAAYTIAADGTQVPAYETPGSFTGSIAGNVLTVSAQASGKLASGQLLAGAGILPGTILGAQLSGDPGGIGTYETLGAAQTVGSETLTTSLTVQAQVQPTTWRDLQMVEGLNLAGERRKIYLYGATNSIIRVYEKGGDLVVIFSGAHAGTWLVAQTVEQWPGWVSAVCTLQNGS